MKGSPVAFVEKGWGHELWIVNKPEYCGKLLFFKEGKKCSYHFHRLKDETFWIARGRLQVTYGWDDDITTAETVVLEKGYTFYVPVGLRHQMLGLEDTEMYEFSTQHFDEDSYRIIKGD